MQAVRRAKRLHHSILESVSAKDLEDDGADEERIPSPTRCQPGHTSDNTEVDARVLTPGGIVAKKPQVQQHTRIDKLIGNIDKWQEQAAGRNAKMVDAFSTLASSQAVLMTSLSRIAGQLGSYQNRLEDLLEQQQRQNEAIIHMLEKENK